MSASDTENVTVGHSLFYAMREGAECSPVSTSSTSEQVNVSEVSEAHEGDGHGSQERKQGACVIQISLNNAKEYNTREMHCGIFASVNSFHRVGTKWPRRKTNIAKVNAWFVEMDDKPKEEQLRLLRASPLTPSMVVESKRGFHAYWVTRDKNLDEHVVSWDRIVKRGLIPYFGGDKKAGDITRILRMPGFYHWKDLNDPFLIRRVWSSNASYHIRWMLKAFPDIQEPKRYKQEMRKAVLQTSEHSDFWERVFSLDCEKALLRLSGTHHVSFEHYDFQENTDGTKQIICEGKASSCWIDQNKKIGSYENGGPSIAQWLNWYHHNYSKVAEIIKEVFPECQTQTMFNF